MKKFFWLSLLLLLGCFRPHISELENRLSEWFITALHKNPEEALVDVCKARVMIKLTDNNWRKFIIDKLEGYDISYVDRAFSKLSWTEQIHIEDLFEECKTNKFILYAEKD